MNPRSPLQMEESAALWAARLDGSDLTIKAQQELAQWLAVDLRHRELLSEYCQFSTDLEDQLPVLLATGGLDLPEIAAVRPARSWRLWLVSGSLAAAATIALTFWLGQPTTQFENLATPAAQRRTLELVEGSKIELDARTSLRVEIDANSRRVRLAEGEAFFAITKDPDRPFIVDTPLGSIRVKGTKFDVQAISTKTLKVTVIEGVVQISPTSSGNIVAPVTLKVGDQLMMNENGFTVRQLSATDLDDVIAWRQGDIIFNGVPLSAALESYGRHHGIGITASPEAAQQKIGGRYSLDDLDGFLTALEESSLNIRVTHNHNGTVQVMMRDK